MSTPDNLQRFLLSGRNPDGGWGYSPGKASRLEPTCWALLALRGRLPDEGLRPIIESWPAADGLLLERAGGAPNHAFHALGLLVLRAFGGEHAATNVALLRGLQRLKGVRIDTRNTMNRQNNRLQGWSWVPETFSWVEPTAWALLALKQYARVSSAHVDQARISEAETLLLDRSCITGGWNYGNSNMLGRELHPYVPTTACAIMALQGSNDHPAVAAGLRFLDESADREASGFALSLAAIALRTMKHSDAVPRAALERQLPTTCSLGHHLGAALSLYALRTDHGDAAFVL